MKAEDLLMALLAGGVVFVMGLTWKKAAEASALAKQGIFPASSSGTTAPYASLVTEGARSWFSPEQQRVFAVPDDSLPGWANL